MYYIIGILLFSIAVAIALIDTQIVKVNLNKMTVDMPSGFRYVHISDIHGKVSFVNGRISKIINSSNPDFVVITGDYSNTQEKLAKVISELANINCSVFMVLGNYEREEEINFFKKRKITLDLLEYEISKYDNLNLLINEEVEIEIKESKISVYGFDNSVYGNEKYNKRGLKSESKYNVILAHSPNILKIINKEQLKYNHILVGHTHGKQINISLNRTAYDKYHIGLMKHGDEKFFSISKGLGTVRLPLRIRSRASIDVFDIVRY